MHVCAVFLMSSTRRESQVLLYNPIQWRRGQVSKIYWRLDESWSCLVVVSSQVGVAHCALECKPKVDWNKGNASLLILEKEFGTEWEKR